MDMPAYRKHLLKCSCGGTPMVRNAQVAEDCVETWAECPACGKHTDYFEDAYSSAEQAVVAWNAGETFEDRRPVGDWSR